MKKNSLAAAWKPCRLFMAVCSVVLWSTVAHADATGKVVRILDGDTMEVLVDRTPLRVRLAEFDALEKRQAFGARAHQALADLASQRNVLVLEAGKD